MLHSVGCWVIDSAIGDALQYPNLLSHRLGITVHIKRQALACEFRRLPLQPCSCRNELRLKVLLSTHCEWPLHARCGLQFNY